MFDYAFYELLYRDGGGYRCPRCYSFQGYADGFGVSRCHHCELYFSVPEDVRPRRTLKESFAELRNWIKTLVARLRGRR